MPTPNTQHAPRDPSTQPMMAMTSDEQPRDRSPSPEAPELPQLPPAAPASANDEFAALQGVVAATVAATVTAGTKRDLENSQLLPRSVANRNKKPRDNRLRECFIITALEGGGENIVCKYCPDYNKTLQKFNPTKSRAHLTGGCTGVDEALRRVLLDTTQAAKRVSSGLQKQESDEGGAEPSTTQGARAEPTPPRIRKTRGPRNRISPAYISFHTDNTSLDVTAPIEHGESILRLAFPSDNLKLSFDAQTGTEAAAMCIDGFMNMKADASWTASMCSMTSEGTRAGPHCQWSLNPSASGTFKDDLSRVQKVEKLLKTMTMI